MVGSQGRRRRGCRLDTGLTDSLYCYGQVRWVTLGYIKNVDSGLTKIYCSYFYGLAYTAGDLAALVALISAKGRQKAAKPARKVLSKPPTGSSWPAAPGGASRNRRSHAPRGS